MAARPGRRESDTTLSIEPARSTLAVPAEAGFSVMIDGDVATISLNRPERLNSQTPHTWYWLSRVGADLPGTVRVVVVRGEGRAFSAGLDRQMFSPEGLGDGMGLMHLAASSDADLDAKIASYQAGFGWLSRPDLVSIAAVQGHAIGGGFQLALACDLRVLTSDAQFTMAEPSLGIVPDLGGTKRLVELVGYSRAAEICLTGRRVPAAEAMTIGLASSVVASDQLDTAVAQLVGALLAVPREAAVETKALLLGASGRSQSAQEAAERDAQARRLRSLVGLLSEA